MRTILLSIALVVVVIGGAGFYWVSIRPSQIKMECAKSVNGFQPYDGQTKDERYQLCLHSKGL
jgi:hypothetical protein